MQDTNDLMNQLPNKQITRFSYQAQH